MFRFLPSIEPTLNENQKTVAQQFNHSATQIDVLKHFKNKTTLHADFAKTFNADENCSKILEK